MGMRINMKVRVDMSRLRWTLAAALAVLALGATWQSMRTYQAHEMTTGLLAVIALAILLLVGLASLGLARLRIGRELVSLRAGSPDGELLAGRRRRLEAIRATRARPDAQVLAEATRADEAGRAYIGRYLVATTVLIGLVGTFAALMQTLGKMAPLFGDKGSGDIALLVAPLAGLHVTFGASLVAILATLALALAQGDLTLCEEQALALLEDRTTHDLIPALWPNSGDAAERSIRALEDLRSIFADTLAQSIDASLKGVAESARGQADRSARALEAVGASVERELARLCKTVESSLEQGVSRQSQALADSAERQAVTVAQTTTSVGKQLAEAGSAMMLQLRGEVEAVIARSADAGNAALGAALTAADAAVARSSSAADQAGLRSTAAIEEMARLSAGAVAESTTRSAKLLEEALQRTTHSAEEVLRGATQSVDEVLRGTARAAEELLRGATASAERLLRGATEATEKAAQATADAVTHTLQPLFADESVRLDGLRGALGEVGSHIEVTAGRMVELTGSLDGLAREHIAAIDRSGQAVLAAFDRAVVGGGGALETAAGTLATAARDLQASSDSLAPRLGALATELGALGREVALMAAARGPEGEIGAVVLGELDRLGAGMDRLAALVRLADPHDGALAEKSAASDAPAYLETSGGADEVLASVEGEASAADTSNDTDATQPAAAVPVTTLPTNEALIPDYDSLAELEAAVELVDTAELSDANESSPHAALPRPGGEEVSEREGEGMSAAAATRDPEAGEAADEPPPEHADARSSQPARPSPVGDDGAPS